LAAGRDVPLRHRSDDAGRRSVGAGRFRARGGSLEPNDQPGAATRHIDPHRSAHPGRSPRAWLALPGEGPNLEFEQLLNVFFADQSSKADALRAVANIRLWAEKRNAENVAVARAYVAGEGPFSERAQVLNVVGRFLTEFADMVGNWAEWADKTIQAWPDDVRGAEPDCEWMEKVAARSPRTH